VRVIVALGGFAWQAAWPALRAAGFVLPRPRPAFGHGAEAELTVGRADTAGTSGTSGRPVLYLGCYHPSQQNTFTGRVSRDMLDDVFRRASEVAFA